MRDKHVRKLDLQIFQMQQNTYQLSTTSGAFLRTTTTCFLFYHCTCGLELTPRTAQRAVFLSLL